MQHLTLTDLEQTPLPPLVSDMKLSKACWRTRNVTDGARELSDLRDIYEQDRQRTREVVQALVNHIAKMKGYIKPVSPPDDKQRQGVIDAYIEGDDALALAKSQLQIEPKP